MVCSLATGFEVAQMTCSCPSSGHVPGRRRISCTVLKTKSIKNGSCIVVAVVYLQYCLKNEEQLKSVVVVCRYVTIVFVDVVQANFLYCSENEINNYSRCIVLSIIRGQVESM